MTAFFGCALGLASARALGEEPMDLAAQAVATAKAWLRQSAVVRDAASAEGISILSVTPMREQPGGALRAYHVALAPRGYLVIRADGRPAPVVCFSLESSLVLDGAPNNLLQRMLSESLVEPRSTSNRPVCRVELQESDRTALTAEDGRVGPTPESAAPAAAGGVLSAVPIATSELIVAPLISTHWAQWNHFNELYPSDPSPGTGYDGKAPVGCVPLAGAQMAKHYAWPLYGSGGHTDIDHNGANLIQGTFDAVFREPIAWERMQDRYNPWAEEPADAVAAVSLLTYDLGVAVDVDYGSFTAGGSLATLRILQCALNRYFFFEPGTYSERPGNEATFDARLRETLEAGQPVPAGIASHVFIIDGWSVENGVNYVHANYGSGGINDGWYQLSSINGQTLQAGVFDCRPVFMPLMAGPETATNVTGTIALSWRLPASRQDEATGFRLREGRYQAGDISDPASDFSAWHNDVDAWFLDSPGSRGGGTCFRKTGEAGRYALTLRDPIRPGPSSTLEFDYKAFLADDRFEVQASIDGGATWTVMAQRTATGWDTKWHHDSIDLSAYAGQMTLIRFEYVFEGGYYYEKKGAVYLDNIDFGQIDRLNWSVLADAIPPSSTGQTLNARLDGVYYFSVQAADAAAWQESSPLQTVIVALDPNLDVDEDRLPNGWEETHFGSVTGGVASADSDADGATNWEEYRAGTDPLSAGSRFAAQSGPAPEGETGWRLIWPSRSNRTYSVRRAESLPSLGAAFLPIATHLAATPPTNEYVDGDAADLPRAYYRVGIEP